MIPAEEHPPMTAIARLTIRLDEVEPKVVRQIEVPLDILLADLHLVIQAAMGWENCHLYEFRLGRGLAWGIPDPHWPDQRTLSAKKASLADLVPRLKKNRTFQYVYDFGDDWQHTIKVGAIAEADPGVAYPRLISAEGGCPPEDCGGPWGYADYLEAMADPSHPGHEDAVRWHGPDFDPNVLDEAALRKAVGKLANRRRKKPKSAG